MRCLTRRIGRPPPQWVRQERRCITRPSRGNSTSAPRLSQTLSEPTPHLPRPLTAQTSPVVGSSGISSERAGSPRAAASFAKPSDPGPRGPALIIDPSPERDGPLASADDACTWHSSSRRPMPAWPNHWDLPSTRAAAAMPHWCVSQASQLGWKSTGGVH